MWTSSVVSRTKSNHHNSAVIFKTSAYPHAQTMAHTRTQTKLVNLPDVMDLESGAFITHGN